MRIVLAYIIRSQPPTTFGSVYLLVEGNPKKFSIHSFQSDLRLLRGINVNFLLCSKATTCLVLSFRKKAQNGHLHISCLFGACIWPLAYVHMPTTALCTYSVPPTPQGFQCWNDSPNCNEKLSHYCNVFSPNSSWLALTIQVFENRVNFDFTHSKLSKFSEILVNWIFTHTIHQIGCNFRWEKLNFHTISLASGSMVYPPWAISANAGVEGSTISMRVTTGPWFRGTPPLNLSFLQKPKVANGFESGT